MTTQWNTISAVRIFRFNRAFCYVIEAAQALCGAESGLATRLLQMALREIAAETAHAGLARRVPGV